MVPIGSCSVRFTFVALSGMDRARELIFSGNDYDEFTNEEKALIDQCRKVVPAMRVFGRSD